MKIFLFVVVVVILLSAKSRDIWDPGGSYYTKVSGADLSVSHQPPP